MKRAPESLTTVDPGVHECAVAEFSGGRLERAYFEKPFTPLGERCMACGVYGCAPQADLAVFEEPQLDNRPPTYVIKLATAGALVAQRKGRRVETRTPSEWKRSTRKPQHHLAGWEALTPAERLIIGSRKTYAIIEAACAKGGADRWRQAGAKYYGESAAAKVHNLLDAVFLGLQVLGRIGLNGQPTRKARHK